MAAIGLALPYWFVPVAARLQSQPTLRRSWRGRIPHLGDMSVIRFLVRG